MLATVQVRAYAYGVEEFWKEHNSFRTLEKDAVVGSNGW